MNVRRAFTLMEVVLAIALTSVVVYLLTTAIQLYMVRIDSSRSRVESAQLARTILDRIAADLAATRLYAPSLGGAGAGGGSGSGPGGSSQQGGGASGSGQSSGQSGGLLGNNNAGSGQQSGAPNGGGLTGANGGAGATAVPATIQGLFGTLDSLRIDRAAYSDWQRAARAVDPMESASAADQPATVRYYFEKGTRQSAEQLAAAGVNVEKRQSNVSGLYRQVVPTASLAAQTDPLAASADSDRSTPVLMAPEVVKLEFAYYNGEKVFQEWDTGTSLGLPSGVEIILTVYEPRDDEENPEQVHSMDQTYAENELVEYRRFVRLPYVSPAQPADALLPAPSSNNQQGSGPSGQGGSGGNGGGQSGQGGNSGQNGGQGGSNGR